MLVRAEPLIIENQTEDQKGIFVGREPGRVIQAQILAQLEALPKNSVLPVDFRNARAVNFSFADEAVAKIARRIAAGDIERRYILLINVGEGPQEDIVAA